MVGENIYEPLEEQAKKIYASLENQADDRVITVERGKIEITSSARLLLNAYFSSTKERIGVHVASPGCL